MKVPETWRLIQNDMAERIYDVTSASIPLPPGFPPLVNRLSAKTCYGTDPLIAESSEQEKERFKSITRMYTEKIINPPGYEGLFLIPCPQNHDNSFYEFYQTDDKIIRIRCDCTNSRKMSSKTPFSSMTFVGIEDNLFQIDLKPHRAIMESRIKYYDPTIEVQKFFPRGSINETDLWINPFASNSTFKICKRNHNGKKVCLIEQRYHQTIIVCNCYDLLKNMRRICYSDNLLQKYEQKGVFKYMNPKHRGYTAEPVEGWAIKC